MWVTPWARWICQRQTAQKTTATSNDVLSEPQNHCRCCSVQQDFALSEIQASEHRNKTGPQIEHEICSKSKNGQKGYLFQDSVSLHSWGRGELGFTAKGKGIRRDPQAAAWLRRSLVESCVWLLFPFSIQLQTELGVLLFWVLTRVLLHYRAWQKTQLQYPSHTNHFNVL